MPTIKTLTQFVLLFLAWIASFYVLTFLTQLTFSPWDAAIDMPPFGTWERTLNDFFQYNLGQFLISIPAILFSIYVTISTFRRDPAAVNRLIMLSWLFIPVVYVAWSLSAFLNNALHPYPPVMYDPNYRGFHRSILPGVALIGLCVIWLWQQSRLAHNA